MLFPASTDPNFKEQVEELKKNPAQWGHHIDSSGKNYHPADWKEVPLVVASTDEGSAGNGQGLENGNGDGIGNGNGAGASPVLDTVADTMTQRERLRLEIRALTAEGRFSGSFCKQRLISAATTCERYSVKTSCSP